MEVRWGNGDTEYGPGIEIALTGEDVARAIEAYMVSHGIHHSGPRTITVNGELCKNGAVYVDPSEVVVDSDGRTWIGRGNGKVYHP
jgi:hypothetical protein